MPSSRPGWVSSIRLRAAAPVAAVIGVSGFLFLVRPLGIANAVDNSMAGNLALSIPFLIAYALGYEAGLAVGLVGVALLVTALQVANGGAFSPIPEMLVLGPWIAGRIVGSRRRLADQLRARNDELLAQQEAYAAEAVRYERSRIAADLHDIVGHALSLMVVQASAGQRAALAHDGSAGDGGSGDGDSGDGGSGGAGARRALEAVAEAAREAQAEVGLLAGLLAGEQAPPPGLGLIAELVRQVQGAGVEVTYRLMADDDAALDAASAEVASRIVTEALTNALKHAPGAPVTVDIRAAGGELTVTVENAAARHSPNSLERAGGGYGLTGMRDRVLARGGRFDAGPATGGGWQVRAVLPAQ
jgi:signal transduction histidine kinase